ncbi:hypothetical protein ATANTOWER_032069 [Ataeniobius toweri]|uniref:Uncharacterized protein n=1 Tax=Ataeniobius toweri TaxID=208326 RepID=A0ABU7B628_9TELE|nr:hypothetical protein [Ataeniobius toweri]
MNQQDIAVRLGVSDFSSYFFLLLPPPTSGRRSCQVEKMGSAGRLCWPLLVLFLLGFRHSAGFWIVNVVFPPSTKPKVPSNITSPLIIDKHGA